MALRKRAPAPSKTSLRLPLPGQEVQPSTRLEDYCLALFGPKNTGKTVLAASFPDTIVFRFETWRRNVNILQYPATREDEPLTWDLFLELVAEEFLPGPYQRLVIDSADAAWNLCEKHVCTVQFGVEKPAQLGKDAWNAYKASQAEWATIFEIIRNAGKTVTWISHCKVRVQKDPTLSRESQDVLDFTLDPKPSDIIKQQADLVWFLHKYGNHPVRRFLTVRSADLSEISTQVRTQLLTPKGDMLYQIELPNIGHDRDSALYQTVDDAWNNKSYGVQEDGEEEPEDDDTPKPPKKKLLLGKKGGTKPA